MQRFSPNTILYDHIVLKEELAFENQNGQQVWAVQDQRTGQALIARFHPDGRVEWFNDNRLQVETQPKAPVEPLPIASAQGASKPATTAGQEPTASAAVSTKKQTTAFVVIMLLLLGVLMGYRYREALLSSLQSLHSRFLTAKADSSQTTSVPSGATADSTFIASSHVSGAEGAPISAQQAVRLLNLLRQIPTEKHPAIFADARQAFTALRQEPDQQLYIDSLYTLCTGRGAQSYLLHQQNGDLVSKKYALEWYQLAYSLKPSLILQERIARLEKNALNRHPKPTYTRKNPKGELFLPDPEVNR